jgi:hypothetical protein
LDELTIVNVQRKKYIAILMAEKITEITERPFDFAEHENGKTQPRCASVLSLASSLRRALHSYRSALRLPLARRRLKTEVCAQQNRLESVSPKRKILAWHHTKNVQPR